VDARRKHRCSAKVVLVLVGTVSLSGCNQEPQQRSVYKSLRDCSEEWGIEKCDPADKRYSTGHYYGPSYLGAYVGRGTGGAMDTRSIGTVSSASRGGFGSSAFGHSRGS